MSAPPQKYFLVNLGNVHDWGVMVNDGGAETPRFRVLFKATRAYAERLLADLNNETQSHDTRQSD
jgi:hypothetical protein